MAEVYLYFLSKPTLMYDLSFTLLLLGGGVLVWCLKIDFKLFFSVFAISDGKKKNPQVIQMKKHLLRQIKTNFIY